jgi:hypothetical protein
MSTFLQICQRVRQECGVAGDGPSSVTGQVGILKKIVDRTARAWTDIQTSRPYWKFRRAQKTAVTVVGQQSYTIETDFGFSDLDKFDRKNTYLYLTDGNDEKALRWMPYDKFRSTYRTYPSGRPTVVTEGPGGTLMFDRTPDEIYTLTFDYWTLPQQLTDNADELDVPTQFDDVLVWKAVMMFAGNETASDLYAYAKTMYTPQYIQLVLDQGDMPESVAAYPIANGARDVSIRGFS